MVAVEVLHESTLIYQQIQRSSASGRGVSYWANDNAAVCGKRLQLTALHGEVKAAAEAADLDSVRRLRTGTLFHGLMEFWFRGTLPPGLVLDVGPIQDTEWAEALRLFNFVRAHFNRDYFGDGVGPEIKLPVNAEHKQKLVEFFGHEEATGAIDYLAMLSAADVARLEAEWPGLRLDGPGLYSWDWKSSDARKSAEAAKAQYTESPQAMMYPTLFNLAGGEQIKGQIYFVVVKHQDLRRRDVSPKLLSSIQVFYGKAQPEHALIIREAITEARFIRNRGKANAFACYINNRPCPFLVSGHCGRI